LTHQWKDATVFAYTLAVSGDNSMNAADFMLAVQPLLQAQDLQGLVELLRRRWSPEQITSFLSDPHLDARKVAALCLSLVGGNCCIGALTQVLKDPDPTVNEMAEHALWSVWFRSGSTEANHQMAQGVKAIQSMDYVHAMTHFQHALDESPDCAEAYNQRAIALYLLERYDESIDDARHAVELMPCHFGAWAGIGHCHAHMGRLAEAVEAYQRALEINPHLHCLREAICEISKVGGPSQSPCESPK
jgi:tetratricopeptide (TPR) repeat protein